MVVSSRQMVQKQRNIFCQRSLERKRGTVMRAQRPRGTGIDEEGEKYKVAYCSDRYTENRDK